MHIRMSEKELYRLQLVREIEQGRLSRREAAALLGVSERQLRRILRRYEKEGPPGLAHRSRGRPSNREIPADIRAEVLSFLKEKRFRDYGPMLLRETLEEERGIRVSRETMRHWMTTEGTWKPRKAKVHHRQWRERKACRGAMIQMDTSIHNWFEGRGEEAVLIGIIDDASSDLLCRFQPTDSTATNMRVLREYIGQYGRPHSFYADKASHFMTTRAPTEDEQRAGKHAQTQIQRALEELDIEHIPAHSPQAKGRIERCFRTLQDRLVKALRRAGIATIEEANAYLDEVFLPLWKQRFTQEPREAADAHRPCKGYDLDAIFSHQETRQVANDYTFAYRGTRYQIDKRSIQPGLRRSKVTIEERLDGSRKVRWRGHYLTHWEVDSQQAPKPEPSPKPPENAVISKPNKPAPDHPWRHGCTLMRAETES